MSLQLTTQQERLLEAPPVFLPDHLEWVRAKAAIALWDFESAPETDTEVLIRLGLRYRALARVAAEIESIINDQTAGR